MESEDGGERTCLKMCRSGLDDIGSFDDIYQLFQNSSLDLLSLPYFEANIPIVRSQR